MGTSQLRELLELLKEFGVTEYAHEGMSLKLGGSISVHNHKTEGKEPREVVNPPDPKLLETFRRLPGEYQKAFSLGQD